MRNNIEYRLHEFIPGEEIKNTEYKKNQQLIITKLDMGGLNDMYEYSKKSIFYRSLNLQPHKNKKDTENYLKELIRRTNKGYSGGHAMYWFIRLKSSQKIIGTFGFSNLNEKEKSVQIGKGLSPDYWGKGYVYELLGIMLSYAFDVLELNYIFSLTKENNIANIKSMEKVGFKISEYIDNCIDGIGVNNKNTVKMIIKRTQAKPEICFNIAFGKYQSL